MQSMSFDPVVGDIAAQLVDIANVGLKAAATAMTPLTSLTAAGGDEVSAQAALAFAEGAAQMLALNEAAHQELMQTGQVLAEIARMYAEVDAAGADTMLLGPMSNYGLANA
jgi:hypothetical protein